MLSALRPLIGIATFASMFAVLMGITVMLIPGVLLRCMPWRSAQRAGARACVWVARRWVAANRVVYRLYHRVPAPGYGHVQINGALDPTKSYLLVCNHQSWADILILFDVFGGRVPFLRFFLKRDLLWVPIVGVACWAMDFPFMKRHSKEAIAKNPQLANEDLETTRRTCEIYKDDPVTVVNFPEGTRFSKAKRDASASPYRQLLRPKAAGLSFTLRAMGEQFGGIIDVTLLYAPSRKNKLWAWLCGEQAEVQVRVEVLPVPPELLLGDYSADPAFRAHFQHWLNGLWALKDAALNQHLPE